jgi:hypothetical protein
VAFVTDARDTDRHDQPVDQRHARSRLDSRPVDLASLSDLNRLGRTRMLGGVGAGEGDLPGYPIRLHATEQESPFNVDEIPQSDEAEPPVDAQDDSPATSQFASHDQIDCDARSRPLHR